MSSHIIDRMLIQTLSNSQAAMQWPHACMLMNACALAIDPHLFAYDLLTHQSCIWFLISRGTVLSCPAVHGAL